MTKLGVNIDHVATLRQARTGSQPNPVFAALVCEQAGADSIVAHLREDRRHIQEKDLYLLKDLIKTRLNLEMSINPGIVAIACKVKPYQSTLVPEKRKELTTEGGLDVVSNYKEIRKAILKLEKNKIPVSLFIDPQKKQIEMAKKIGALRIELHTGKFANAKTEKEQSIYLEELKIGADYASQIGLQVFAGHGLDYHNVEKITTISVIEELNIGYSIICRAVFVGLAQAVSEMKKLITN